MPIPISGAERYVIRGKVHYPRLTENYFTLWNAHMGTVDVLDGKSLMLLIGTEVDFVEDDLRSEFVFKNPKAKSKCGCGESFEF